MAKVVSIIFNEDGKIWAEYLQGQLEETVSTNVFLQLDAVLFGNKMDIRSEIHILKSDIVIVIVTPGHMDFLLTKNTLSYDKFVPNAEKAILFLTGVTEEEINKDTIRKETRRIFVDYDGWAKIQYTDETSINILMEKVVEILERPEPVMSKFSLVPSTVHCEEETVVIALIDTAVPEDANVCAVVKGSYFDEVLPCQRANPYTYTFVMPKHIEDEMTVFIKINKQSLRTQAKLSYKSYISCSDQTAINEIYCYMLDQLCSYMKVEITNSEVNKDIDHKLSAVFDHIVDLPAVGYEKLFGIYQYLNEENSRRKIPNLVHLGVKHNLKELVDCLGKLPHFFMASCISNSENNTPRQAAESLGFTELAELLKCTEEQNDMYFEMAGYIKSRFGDTTETINSGDKKRTKLPVEDNMYMDMSSGKSATTVSKMGDFYLGKAAPEVSQLTVPDKSTGYRYIPRQTVAAQEKWQRNSNRSSDASTASRSSSSSFLSSRGSFTSCSSGIEEDFEPRVARPKLNTEKSLSEPPSGPVLETHPEVEDTLDSVPLEAPPPIPVLPNQDLPPPNADRIHQTAKKPAKTIFRLRLSSQKKTANSSKTKPSTKQQ